MSICMQLGYLYIHLYTIHDFVILHIHIENAALVQQKWPPRLHLQRTRGRCARRRHSLRGVGSTEDLRRGRQGAGLPARWPRKPLRQDDWL